MRTDRGRVIDTRETFQLNGKTSKKQSYVGKTRCTEGGRPIIKENRGG